MHPRRLQHVNSTGLPGGIAAGDEIECMQGGAEWILARNKHVAHMPKSNLITSTTGMERNLETVSSFRKVFGLLKEYLKHLGVFSSTIAVVLTACALKGTEEII